MHIKVTTTAKELADMGLTAEQLQYSVADCLNDHACGPDGDRMDYSGFNVEVEVIPSADEFLQPGAVHQAADA